MSSESNRSPDFADTVVFWDVVDYPVPEGRGSIHEILCPVLEDLGWASYVSIKAYGETETNPYPGDEVIERPDNYFSYTEVKKSKYWRLNKMKVDMGIWAAMNPQPFCKRKNMMVVAKNMDEDFIYFMGNLNISVCKISIIIDEGVVPLKIPRASFGWYWNVLLNRGKPLTRTELENISGQ